MTTLTKLEIIDETVEFYGADPIGRRALKSNPERGDIYCVYKTDDGRKCAFGRVMLQDMLDEYYMIEGTVDGLITDIAYKRHGVDIEPVLIDTLNEVLMLPYRGHSILFWADLQGLHDNNQNWDMVNGGLSERGLIMVNDLKAKWVQS